MGTIISHHEQSEGARIQGWGKGWATPPTPALFAALPATLATHAGSFPCKASRKYSSQDTAILLAIAPAFLLPGPSSAEAERVLGVSGGGECRQRVRYSQEAATKQTRVAQATTDTTFHCLAEAKGIHPGREREEAEERGAAPAPSREGINSQSKLGCRGEDGSLGQEFTPLGDPCLVKPLPGWVGWGLTNVALCYAQMSTIIGHPLFARS